MRLLLWAGQKPLVTILRVPPKKATAVSTSIGQTCRLTRRISISNQIKQKARRMFPKINVEFQGLSSALILTILRIVSPPFTRISTSKSPSMFSLSASPLASPPSFPMIVISSAPISTVAPQAVLPSIALTSSATSATDTDPLRANDPSVVMGVLWKRRMSGSEDMMLIAAWGYWMLIQSKQLRMWAEYR